MKLVYDTCGSAIRIFKSYIPFSVRMKEAVREGQNILKYDASGKVSQAFMDLTKEVLGYES